MRALALLCLLLYLLAVAAGCAEHKPAKSKVVFPPGYVPDGYCIADGINAKTGKNEFLICKTKDGTETYKRYKRQ